MYKQPKVRTTLLVDCLEALTNECALDNCNIVILGDLNVNMLKSNLLSDWLDISGLKNVIKEPTFCRYGKMHFTNASALAVKYGTRRAKPAGSAIEFCLLSARYDTLFRSLRLILTRPPSRQN